MIMKSGLLEQAEIDIAKERRFLHLAKALFGSVRFLSILGKCKADTIEGRKALKSPTARLIWRVTQAVNERVMTARHTGLQDGTELREILARRDRA